MSMIKNTTATTPRGAAQQKFTNARHNLLLMLALTVINIILFACGSETMMLFSATVPYYAVVFGALSESQALLIAGVIVAVVAVVVYLLCWIFSKKHFVWMLIATAFFVLDTIAMVALYIWAGDVSGVLDMVIHIWVLYYLIMGTVNGYKLKSLPEEEPIEVPVAE